MSKKLFFVALLIANIAAALGPTIECRFGALDDDGDVGLDEFVGYTMDPGMGISGSFDPYDIDISVVAGLLQISIYVDGDPVGGIRLPVENVVSLPLGASLFGLSIVFHDPADGLTSIRYECRKVVW